MNRPVLKLAQLTGQ